MPARTYPNTPDPADQADQVVPAAGVPVAADAADPGRWTQNTNLQNTNPAEAVGRLGSAEWAERA